MAARQIKWSSLLRYAELEFDPEPPKVLEVSDELTQSLSWLTAATKQDRRLLRCTEQGALLIAQAYEGLNSVETDELYPDSDAPDTFTPAVEHNAVLIATSDELTKISFLRKSGGVALDYYVPPSSFFFFPYSCYSIVAGVVPATGGARSYIGVVCLI